MNYDDTYFESNNGTIYHCLKSQHAKTFVLHCNKDNQSKTLLPKYSYELFGDIKAGLWKPSTKQQFDTQHLEFKMNKHLI